MKRFLTISLVATAILLFALVPLGTPPASTTIATSHLPAPTHLTHPMVPVTNPSGAAALTNSPVSCPEPGSECLASYNWGGYAVCSGSPTACSAMQAAPGTVTHITGMWTVPAITSAEGAHCSDGENTWYDNSVWIGIDGLFSTTVEQTGTSSDCFYGQTSYYAWYEFYPAASVSINTITVNAGDKM